jgi:hypothetical protein
MPSKGQGWQWQHVCVDGTDLQVRATCNGTTASASYYRQAPGPVACYPQPQPAPGVYDPGYLAANPAYYDPYSYPDGSVTVSDYAGPCEEAALRQWAVDGYPGRTGGISSG